MKTKRKQGSRRQKKDTGRFGSVHKRDLIQRFDRKKKTARHLLCAWCSTFIISCYENNSAESLKINFQKEFTHFPSTPGESERRCCSPTGCSAALWPPSSPAAQENQGKICQKRIHLTLNFYYFVQKKWAEATGGTCVRAVLCTQWTYGRGSGSIWSLSVL